MSGGNDEQPLSSTVKDPLQSPSAQKDPLSPTVTKVNPPVQPQVSISYEKDIQAARERDKEKKRQNKRNKKQNKSENKENETPGGPKKGGVITMSQREKNESVSPRGLSDVSSVVTGKKSN